MEFCEGCIHLKYIKEVVRGVMDCDPPEYYCDKLCDWFYFDFDDDELIEHFSEEEIEYGCPEWRSDDV